MKTWNDDNSSDASDKSMGSEIERDEEDDSWDNRYSLVYSAEEKEKLQKRVRLHGEGNWKAILNNSKILQKRYKSKSLGTFGLSLQPDKHSI